MITFIGYCLINLVETLLVNIIGSVFRALNKALKRSSAYISGFYKRQKNQLPKIKKTFSFSKYKSIFTKLLEFKLKNVSFRVPKLPSIPKLPTLKLPAFSFPKLRPGNKIIFFSLGLVCAFIFILVPLQVYAWIRQLPNPNLLAQQATNSSTKILDRNGKLLYEIYVDRNYEPVALNKVPADVIDATLAIEDSEFYQHHGIRFNSIVRAARASLFEDNLQGASTITQQLIKNVLLTPERTLSRKLKEIVLALWVERIYTKNQILEFYLNNTPYGGTAWGVEAGAKKIFGKDIDQLDLAESAMLAGLPSAPSVYSPVDGDINLSKLRQKQVLLRMVDQKYITQQQADVAYDEELHYAPQVHYIKAPHFVEYVRKQLEQTYGERMTDFGGLTVRTTLDLDLQEKVQQIVKDEVAKDARLNISNGAAVVLDTRTREILAYVGSIDYFQDDYGAYDVVTAL
ncbi:MAG TPA: transglycosylase domain-containing protein, partial [Candidatus Saccharimonadales bacterium]|nr:transglycosylase domain-containing protein [Candidatus Saccharimonadales bacterium]